MSSGLVEAAAEQLRLAAETGVPCAPVRDVLGTSTDVDTAYEVQRRNVELAVAAGRRVSGHKVGLTASVVQQQLGVDQPDYGVLFADMCLADGADIEPGQLLQPRVEAEVAVGTSAAGQQRLRRRPHRIHHLGVQRAHNDKNLHLVVVGWGTPKSTRDNPTTGGWSPTRAASNQRVAAVRPGVRPFGRLGSEDPRRDHALAEPSSSTNPSGCRYRRGRSDRSRVRW